MLSCYHLWPSLVIQKRWFISWRTISCVLQPPWLSIYIPYILVHAVLKMHTINSNDFQRKKEEICFGGIQMAPNQRILGPRCSYLACFKLDNNGFITVYHIGIWEKNSRRVRSASISSVFECINSLLLSSPSKSSHYLLFLSPFHQFW